MGGWMGNVNVFFIRNHFLGPRGPLRIPLMSVPSVVRPSATKIHATSPYSLSDSKLILFHIQTLSPHNLSHSTQNTEQDHLADLSSPIWSCFIRIGGRIIYLLKKEEATSYNILCILSFYEDTAVTSSSTAWRLSKVTA